MKKSLSILIIIIIVSLAMTLISCTDDYDVSGVVNDIKDKINNIDVTDNLEDNELNNNVIDTEEPIDSEEPVGEPIDNTEPTVEDTDDISKLINLPIEFNAQDFLSNLQNYSIDDLLSDSEFYIEKIKVLINNAKWEILSQLPTYGLSYTLNYDDTYSVSGYSGKSKIILIPRTYKGKPITSVDDNVFMYNENIECVIMLNNMKEIGNWTFYGCSNLKYIYLPNTITLLKAYAFGSCFALPSINIPDSVVAIWNGVFENCLSLTKIYIPSNVSLLHYKVFGNCPKLEEINVSVNNLHYKSIEGVLYNIDATTIIRYPQAKIGVSYSVLESVTTIWDGAFEACKQLVNITLPDGLLYINQVAFCDCSALLDLYLPEGLLSIGSAAFSYCTSFVNINIPSSVTYIDEQAFNYNPKLVNINVAQDNLSYASIDGIMFSKDMRTILLYPIARTATSYTIPNGVGKINWGAFAYCSNLIEVTIPHTVNYISYNSFDYCTALTNIYSYSNVPPYLEYGTIAFFMCFNVQNIYVPMNSVDAYKSEWNNYADIIKPIIY